MDYTQAEAAEELRQQKQNYLMENIVNIGYDTDLFATYMNSQRGKQINKAS